MAGKSWEVWDDRLYCRNYDDYVLKTPVKSGWPASGRIEVEPESPLENWSCNGAEFMNTGRKIPWTVEDGKVVLKLDGMQPDPVVSVIRLSVVVSRQ